MGRFAVAAIAAAVIAVPASAHEGNVTFRPENTDPVVFSHDYHTQNRGIKCAACHFLTFSASRDSFQMKKEKITKRDFCEHCHNGLKGFDARSEKNCVRCHRK